MFYVNVLLYPFFAKLKSLPVLKFCKTRARI